MENIKIVILHQDLLYAQTLASALTERWKITSVIVATRVDEAEPVNADFILCGQAKSALGFGLKGIHIYDDKEDLIPGVASIARFQPIGTIVAELKSICTRGTSKPLKISQAAGNVLFIGITSGSGGIGTSTAAVILGRILSRLYSKKTLYIAFERSNPADCAFSFEHSALPLNNLLYRISTGDTAFLKMISEYTGVDSYGLHSMFAPSDVNPLTFASEDDLFNLLRVIAEYGSYERVILDVPFGSAYWESMMRMCEKQIINYGFRRHCHAASDKAKSELKNLCELDSTNPDNRIAELYTLWDEDSFTIKEDGFDVDIHGQLGAEVRELADRMESA